MAIRINGDQKGIQKAKASFRKNWLHYLQEAFGLAIFMVSACLFASLLESKNAYLHNLIINSFTRNCMMGILMGSTALLIFYSPLTAPSGAHINPAVSLSFLRLGKMCPWDVLFYCFFQFTGGTVAVMIMQRVLGTSLTDAPVNSAVTEPGGGIAPAMLVELSISFITMSMVLYTSHHEVLKKYTRLFAGCLVCVWVILAGPISGFGMNPARSFASAIAANKWAGWWIYMFIPIAGMLLATECFAWYHLRIQKKSTSALQA